MTAPAASDFGEFIRPLAGDTGTPPDDRVPLSRLPLGDYALLSWLDDVAPGLAPDAAAEITARWDEVTLRDVYDMLSTGNDARGARTR